MSDTIVWISGATEGLGRGLAETVPYPDARVINLSRRAAPGCENLFLDLARRETWAEVGRHFQETLAGFSGRRAIFIQNAVHGGGFGPVSTLDPDDYVDSLTANAVAPLVLGDLFLRAVGPGYESGLVMLSSAAARHPYEGQAGYCAAKAGVEMWVRVVRRELKRRGAPTWVVAVRPGFVDTGLTRKAAELPENVYPTGLQLKAQLESGEGVLSPQAAARDIWAALSPPPDTSLLLFGQMAGGEDATPR
jgi:benzil reductase ((S)-benzoin forming)